MKFKKLSLAILGATAISTAAADVTVYGKANISLNKYDIESSSPGEDNWKLESNNSRLGVKGSYAINDNLKAIYKMEFQVYIDDGDSGGSKGNDTFEQRNIYAGLQGNFGTLIAGKHDTPTKMAQGSIDRFNDLPLGDIGKIVEGENRQSNIIMYTTPKLGDFSFTAAVVPGEDNEDGSDDGAADGVSLAVSYKVDNLYLAVTNDSDIDSRDITRFVAEYSVGAAKIGMLLQTAELANGGPGQKDDEDAYMLSGEYKLNDTVVLKAQYILNEMENGISDDEKTQLALGADYKLSKAAKLFAYVSTIETDRELAGDIEDKTFAVGYVLKF